MGGELPREGLRWFVTTTRRPSPQQEQQARRLAAELGLPFIRRRDRALDCPEQAPACAFLVVERDGLAVHVAGRRLAYHPGMALHRIRALQAGGTDPMVEAMGLRGGEQVLDATLGLGSDALVAAYAAGPRGSVTGVEKVPALAALTREGLRRYPWEQPALAEAAARIRVVADDHRAFMERCGKGSFDVVYFDAMFDRTLPGSSAMAAWRLVADEAPLAPEAVALALKVARRRVVVKDRRDSPRLLALLSPPRRVGGRSSRVEYGVWELEDRDGGPGRGNGGEDGHG